MILFGFVFIKYLKDNWNDMKNTWKGIKNIIVLKTASSNSPRAPSVNDIATTNPCGIASTFNNYFTSNAKNNNGKH